MGFVQDNIYPQILGNDYAYLPLDLWSTLLLTAFSIGLAILYSTPIPQIFLYMAGEFDGKDFWESLIWLTATWFSLWGLQQSFMESHAMAISSAMVSSWAHFFTLPVYMIYFWDGGDLRSP